MKRILNTSAGKSVFKYISDKRVAAYNKRHVAQESKCKDKEDYEKGKKLYF